MSISIIIPVYNEKETCELFVNVLLSTLKVKSEIIIVYDSIEDNTIPSIDRLKSKYPNVSSVLNNNRGAVNAFKEGVKLAKNEIILLSTIDEIFPIIMIDDMYELITEKDCDLVSGTRYKFGGKRYGGFFLGKNLSRLANFIFRLITNFPLSDSTTGLKMFKKKIFEKIEIKSNPVGWAFAFEIAVKFATLNVKFGEVPLVAVDRVYGGISTFKGKTLKWSDEYFRWFKWGVRNLKRSNQKKIITLDKYNP